MQITLINVGYGEAVLVRQGGFVMLIDGGSGEAEEYAGSAQRIRCLDFLRAKGVDHIDLMVNSHIHEDHTSGLYPVARALSVGEMWTNLLPELPDRDLDEGLAEDAGMSKFIRALNDHRRLVQALGAKVRSPCRGLAVEVAPGLTVEALGPDPMAAKDAQAQIRAIWQSQAPAGDLRRLDGRMNNLSLILRLGWRGRHALLVGDTNRAGYGRLAGHADLLRAELFKIGHHGQLDGADERLLRLIRPQYVAFSASSDRRYGSAHPDMAALVKEMGAVPLFTDPPGGRHQGVTFRFDGEGLCWAYEFIDGGISNAII